MAITQDRMLTLLAEYGLHIAADQRLREFVKNWLQGKADLGYIPKELIEEFSFRIESFPIPTKERHAVESYHFFKNKKSNERRAGKMRERRLAEGIQPREPFSFPDMSQVEFFGLSVVKRKKVFEEDESKLTAEEKEQMAMMREFQREHPHGSPLPKVPHEKPWDPLHVPELDLDNE